MKILHLSDLHLGVSFKSLKGYNVGRHVNENILDNIEKCFRYAVDNQIDTVLISGDIFNNIFVSYYYAHRLVDKLKILYDKRIPVVMVAGNHDAPKMRGMHTPLVVLSRLGIENIHYQEGLPDKPIKLDVNGEKIGILPLPYIPISSADDHNEKIREFIEVMIKEMSDVDIRILVTHYDVAGARYSESDPLANSYYKLIASISPSSFMPEEFDYIALGHIHLHQVIRGYDNMYYSGSIDRMNFGEAGEDKGFIIVDLERGSSPKVDFIRVDPVKMVSTPDLDVGDEDPLSNIIDFLEDKDIEGSLLRINIRTNITGWRKLREKESTLDNYLLTNRKVVGYRIDRDIRRVKGEIEIGKLRLDRGDWLLEMMEKYIESLGEIKPEDKAEMKKYVRKLFEELQ
jgi:exonuclease SbcD